MITNKNRKILGFTLAEVLITLAIIGVVAAVTIPTLIKNIQERDWKTSSSSFERKLGEAVRIMNAQRLLSGYSTTKQFVDELGNYIKILKTCDSDSLQDCFPNKVIIDDEGNTINLDNIKVDALGHSNYKTELIGVQFANGISALVGYNPNIGFKEDDEIVKFANNDKYVKMNTTAFTMLYDVSGFEQPNQIGKDINGINSTFNTTCTQIENEPYCILDLGHNYSAVNCSRTGYNDDYCGSNSSGSTPDYWAGAVKACKDKSMRLPSLAELNDIKNIGEFGVDGIPNSDVYWVIDEWDRSQGKTVSFGPTNPNYYSHGAMKDSQYAVLCIN